jgi:hypothetical protein
MNIAYYHASKFGNGAMVAEEFKKIMAARGGNGQRPAHPGCQPERPSCGQQAPVVLVSGRGLWQLVTGFDDQAAVAR